MKIQISKRFVKDTERISDPRILAKIRDALEAAKPAETVIEIPCIDAITGHPGFYRIKFDDRYRIGVYFDQDTLQFLRVGARGDFYKKFP